MRAGLLALIVLVAPVAANAAGDPIKGKAAAAPCTACHTFGKGEPAKVGPNLNGIFGKTSGTNMPSYNYSEAMKKAGIVWSEETLRVYLKKPSDVVPGTKMTFPGYAQDEMRDNVIAYLKEATK